MEGLAQNLSKDHSRTERDKIKPLLVKRSKLVSTQKSSVLIGLVIVALFVCCISESRAGDAALKATLRIQAHKRSPHNIPKYITGKFCEHLGFNIYHGMDAQILHNPTLAEYPFCVPGTSPDGVAKFHTNHDEIQKLIRKDAPGFGWPQETITDMAGDWKSGLACWWTLEGKREDITVSPDVRGPKHRAQRVEVKTAGQGIAQWTYLPLHRVRKYEFELIVRSPDISTLTVSLTGPSRSKADAKATVKVVSNDWKTFKGYLELKGDIKSDAAYKFSVTADSGGQFVIERALLLPGDHINGSDPDVIKLLKESKLPLLRWPGGNFVSSYHWEDGIGKPQDRHTLPNEAWGRVETNLFGTDEFIAFCRAVGCEPMICVNAGGGAPQEAARWIEYCNGSVDTPMGALRAANGHPEPYNVRHWEVGNELWGGWQYYWTTGQGNLDRYRIFSKAMLAADPDIILYATGSPVFRDADWDNWNDALFKGAAPRRTTDHPLLGGAVPADTEPLDVYRDFMTIPIILEQRWGALEEEMKKAGIVEPRLAVTELQLFAHVGRAKDPDAPAKLTKENLVRNRSLAEPIYDVLIYHAAIRLAPFVDMVTHSATINHGGGLGKKRERVFAYSTHYGQAMFADFNGAVPVDIELNSPKEKAAMTLWFVTNNVTEPIEYSSIDVLAAIATDGDLIVSIVHRGTKGPIELAVDIDGYDGANQAKITTLSADVPWAANTLDEPDKIKPSTSSAQIKGGKLTLDLKPYSLVTVRIPKALR